jgi:hypothetical protein
MVSLGSRMCTGGIVGAAKNGKSGGVATKAGSCPPGRPVQSLLRLESLMSFVKHAEPDLHPVAGICEL